MLVPCHEAVQRFLKEQSTAWNVHWWQSTTPRLGQMLVAVCTLRQFNVALQHGSRCSCALHEAWSFCQE